MESAPTNPLMPMSEPAIPEPVHVDSERYAAIMALFEDLPGGGRACILEPYKGMLDLQVSRLKAAVASGDANLLQDSAHSLKGGSRDLGFVRFGELAELLERIGRERRSPTPETWRAFLDEQLWVSDFLDRA